MIAAYRGEETFKDAPDGRFDKLLANNKSNTFPWFINYRRSSVTTTEDLGTNTCNIYRDFETTWTEIQLRNGSELTMTLGYAVYENQNDISTEVKGYVEDYKLKVLDTALLGMNQMTSLAIATLATALFF